MNKEFNFSNHNIKFDENFINYNELRKQFIQLSLTAYNEFKSAYSKVCFNIEDVHDKVLDLGFNCISKNVTKAISILVENDLMHIDGDTFIEKYYLNLFTWENDFKEIDTNYSKILNDEKGKTSLFNSLGKSIEKEKKKIFDDNIKEELAKYIKSNVFNMHYAIVDALRKNGVKIIGNYVTKEGVEKGTALLNNLEIGLIPKEKQDRIIKEIIYSNPYNKDIYIYLLKTYGDKNGHIDEAAKFLDINILEDKNKLIIEYYKKLPKETEEKTLDSLMKFKQFADDIKVEETKKYLDEFDIILKRHDIKIRTVDGIVLKTRKEAELARSEYEEIINIKRNINCDSEKVIQNAIDEIIKRGFKTQIKDRHLSELNRKLVEVIRFEEELFLNENFNINNFPKEAQLNDKISQLKSLKFRNNDLVSEKIEEFEVKLNSVIESKDIEFIEAYFRTVVILNEEDLGREIRNIRNLQIRTKRIKEEKIKYIKDKSEKIIRKHNDMLNKAMRYEERINSLKVTKNSDSKGVMGVLSKVIEKGANFIEDIQEKKEKEAWEFITNSGTRDINLIKKRVN